MKPTQHFDDGLARSRYIDAQSFRSTVSVPVLVGGAATFANYARTALNCQTDANIED